MTICRSKSSSPASSSGDSRSIHEVSDKTTPDSSAFSGFCVVGVRSSTPFIHRPSVGSAATSGAAPTSATGVVPSFVFTLGKTVRSRLYQPKSTDSRNRVVACRLWLMTLGLARLPRDEARKDHSHHRTDHAFMAARSRSTSQAAGGCKEHVGVKACRRSRRPRDSRGVAGAAGRSRTSSVGATLNADRRKYREITRGKHADSATGAYPLGAR